MRGRGFFIIGLIIASLARVAWDEPVDVSADPRSHDVQANMLSWIDDPSADMGEGGYLDPGSHSNAKDK